MSIQNLMRPPEESTGDETDIESGSEIEPSCELSFNTSFLGITTIHHNSFGNDEDSSNNSHLDTTRDDITDMADRVSQSLLSYDNSPQHDDNSETSYGSGGEESMTMMSIGEIEWRGGMRWIWACLVSICTGLKPSEESH